jgi:hypothetical protein
MIQELMAVDLVLLIIIPTSIVPKSQLSNVNPSTLRRAQGMASERASC